MVALIPFAVCFEQHAAHGRVWAVKFPMGDIDDDQGWQFAHSVIIQRPTQTVYRGLNAEQPKAYLMGECDGVVLDYTLVSDEVTAVIQ